jgi:glycosyltransferase involved in cell wall biosynthesis
VKSILLIARKYPPSVGGMQIYSKNLADRLSQRYKVDKIVMGHSQLNLVWFIPYMFLKALFLALVKKYDIIYLCDALLAPAGLLLKKISGAKVFATVHGLDITYNKFFYQRIVPPAVKGLDKVICVSKNTMVECIKRGISREKCVVIANGVDRAQSVQAAGTGAPSGKKIITTVGRLVRRKGVAWFVENVMPKLGDDYVYMVVGEGPEKENINNVIRNAGVSKKVFLLGRIPDRELDEIYRTAHAVVVPNQLISDDPEGFGIVAIEAASCGVPVIANNVDGLSDAVIDGKTGWLIGYNDIRMFIDKIKNPALERDSVKAAAGVFSWDNVIKRYCEVIDAA